MISLLYLYFPMKGKLYMVPVTLGDTGFDSTIPAGVLEITRSLRLFAVEEIRTARRYLRLIDRSFPIDEAQFFSIGKHSSKEELSLFFEKIISGTDAGVMSEAGMPGIADPGAVIAAEAHTRGIRVIPLTGPSSIMLGLAASGLNGQSFAFNGYLPITPDERTRAIRDLEKKALEGQTQIFIETPFRNEKMLTDLLNTCRISTKLCIACDITMADETIITKSVDEWKSSRPLLSDRQVVFFLATGKEK
jgi:16S rRNA (cytidine1402-2'-O)-methyltransferase